MLNFTFIFLMSCGNSNTQSKEHTTLVKMSLDVPGCEGSIDVACAAYGTSEETCNTLTSIDCVWIDGACIPETDCNALSEESCNLVASYTLPLKSCMWTVPVDSPVCGGSIAEACRVYGVTETTCNELPKIDCQWIDNACIPETDCNELNEQDCYIANTPASSCTWGATCYGNLDSACRYYGATETLCVETYTGLHCRWTGSECFPATNCASLDQASCKSAALISGSITSCSWGVATYDEKGTCAGNPNDGGEGQCQMNLTKETCTDLARYIFAEPICEWIGSSCHVKSTVCTNQTNAMLCFSITPPSYWFGDCTWTPDQ